MSRALAVLLPFVFLACANEPLLAPGEVATYAAHVELVILRRCLSCHSIDDPQGQLVLEAGLGYDQLVFRDSIQVGTPLVTPGDPDACYLWRKLVHAEDIRGKGMPKTTFGSRRLPQRELDLIRAWIVAGAGR